MTDVEVYQEPTTEVVAHRQQHSIGDLALLADRIARTNMVPSVLKGKPDEVLATFLYGSECGLPVMQSLQLIDMIQGRPTLNAQGQRALILGAGHQFWIESSSPTAATACGIRKGTERVVSASFTIEEARAAGLTNKDAWKKNPEDMLVARATTRLARQAFSDVTLGLAYDAEELQQGGVALTEAPAAPAVERAPEPLGADRLAKFEDYCRGKGVDPAEVIAVVLGGDDRDLTAADVPALAKAADEIAAAAAKTSTPPVEDGEGGVGAAPPAPPDPPEGMDMQAWVDTAEWASARKRFMAVVTKRTPSYTSKDREAWRKAWMMDEYGIDSIKVLSPEDLHNAADRLEAQAEEEGELVQPSLDDIVADAEVLDG